MIETQTTQKGQVTIPKPYRDKLGINAGTRLVWELHRDTLFCRRADRLTKGEAILARLAAGRKMNLSARQLLKLTRDYDSR
jgi:AbrB family looped-hinge helix DNA binding protein